MSNRYRLTHTARADIAAILAWSSEQFGHEARARYEALLAAAIRDAASSPAASVSTSRPDVGEGIFFWHLSRSRPRPPVGRVRHPRHFLVCRFDGDVLVIGRVLHEAMDPRRHLEAGQHWQ